MPPLIFCQLAIKLNGYALTLNFHPSAKITNNNCKLKLVSIVFHSHDHYRFQFFKKYFFVMFSYIMY